MKLSDTTLCTFCNDIVEYIEYCFWTTIIQIIYGFTCCHFSGEI